MLNISAVQKQKRKIFNYLIFRNITAGKRIACVYEHINYSLLDLVLEKARGNNIFRQYFNKSNIIILSIKYYKK